MKEEDKILKKISRENPFRVPEGYFDSFASEMMSRLPEKENLSTVNKEPTTWEKVRPWLYMAAMFIGAALIIRVASSSHAVDAETLANTEDEEVEMEYIHMAVENAMMDDYSLYVYLTDFETE